jgi:hypothetical protein
MESPHPGNLPGVNPIWCLASFLVVPGLFLLGMLMEWLETHLVRDLLALEIESAWHSSRTPEELELLVSRRAALLLSPR